MKKIISIWLVALMLAAQPLQAAVCVGFGQSGGCSGDYGNHQSNTTQSAQHLANVLQLIYVTIDCNGTSGSIYAYLRENVAGSHSFRLTIIDDDDTGGEPGTILYRSDSLSFDSNNTWVWQNAAFGNLSPGSYWIGVWTDADELYFTYTASVGVARYATVSDFASISSVASYTFTTSTAWRAFYLSF